MPVHIAPFTFESEVVQGIEVDIEFAAGNDRKEAVFLWDDTLQELKQIADSELRSLCFPSWQPTEASAVQEGQPVILSHG